MDEVLYEDIEYKGTVGSLTLNDELLCYRAHAPRKTAVRCSLALLQKRQVSSKSAVRQYVRLETRSGKTATFYVQDRETLEEIREDMRGRIEKMRQKRALQKQREEQQQQLNPVRQFFQNYFQAAAPQSSSVQRLLQEDGDTMHLLALQRKYAREIKQDAKIIDLEQQIEDFKSKLQQQRVQRVQFNKQKIQMEKEQSSLTQQTLKLRLALQDILHPDDTKTKEKQSRRDYTKAIQKATANNKKPNPSMYTMGTQSKTSSDAVNNRKAQKESIELETTILIQMHHQMTFQNQSSLAQKHTLIVKSLLMREKNTLHEYHAQDLQVLVVLEGTINALTELYPDIVLRQEFLMDQCNPQNIHKKPPATAIMNGVVVANNNGTNGGVPTLVLSAQAMRLKAGKRPSVSKSDGISDLGESLHGGRGRQVEEYHPPAAMTTVHSLQQSTLNQDERTQEHALNLV